MSLAESPQFIDGLDKELAERRVYELERYEKDSFEKEALTPDLALIKSDKYIPHIYYVERNGGIIANYFFDHEEGITKNRWYIDSENRENPLFFIETWKVRDPHSIALEVGFSTRNINWPNWPSRTTANYKDVEGAMRFSEVKFADSSLTNGEETEPEVVLENNQVIINNRLKNGVVETVKLPQIVSYDWFSMIYNFSLSSLRDPSMPYLKWAEQLGATFQLQSPFGKVNQGQELQ